MITNPPSDFNLLPSDHVSDDGGYGGDGGDGGDDDVPVFAGVRVDAV